MLCSAKLNPLSCASIWNPLIWTCKQAWIWWFLLLPLLQVPLTPLIPAWGPPGCRDRDRVLLTLSFLLALNFFRHSTVSCLCIIEATVERCCREKGSHRAVRLFRSISLVPRGENQGGLGKRFRAVAL